MLTLRNSAGTDLVVTPPEPVNIALLTAQGSPYTVTVYGVEDDTGLAPQYLTGTISWNDGIHVDQFPYTSTSAGTLTLTATQTLAPGYHNIGIYVRNYRAPVADEAQVNLSVTVVTQQTSGAVPRYLYGPILPKDMGYPNPSQWDFNMDSDLAILASSVKMLVETRIGERIMQPGYGTDLSSLIFELSVDGIENIIQEKIAEALAQWEPRVSIRSAQVNRKTDRSVELYLQLISNLTQQEFSVSTTITNQ